MPDSRERVCRTCFGVLLVVGVGFLFLGLIVVPLLPRFELDVVLTPDELADPHRRDETLVLLRRAAGRHWLFWAAAGVVVIVTSGIGLWASLRPARDETEGKLAEKWRNADPQEPVSIHSRAQEQRQAMLCVEGSHRGFTDSCRRILKQIPSRAMDRGPGLLVTDEASIVMLALWSVLLWERKVGLVALEQTGGNRFDLIRDLDRLLQEKASELPAAFDRQQVIGYDDRQRVVVLDNPRQPYVGWDTEDLLEPLLRQADHEAKDLGHDYVGSEHLVLAIVKLADPGLAALLQQHGLSHRKITEAVVSLLHP